MKNSSHIIIWGLLFIPITIGWFYVLPSLVGTTYFVIFIMIWFCGYGFFIQEMLRYFEKREIQNLREEKQ